MEDYVESVCAKSVIDRMEEVIKNNCANRPRRNH